MYLGKMETYCNCCGDPRSKYEAEGHDPECFYCDTPEERNMNLDSIIGKPLSEVKRLLVMHDMIYRISSSDGISQTLTCDYNPARVNLRVEDNLVKSYFIG